jgi:hypothetical protein
LIRASLACGMIFTGLLGLSAIHPESSWSWLILGVIALPVILVLGLVFHLPIFYPKPRPELSWEEIREQADRNTERRQRLWGA